jgi:hypothetical protein
MRPFETGHFRVFFGMLAIALPACGSVVIIEGEGSADAVDGEGGAGATLDPTSGSSSSGEVDPPPVAEECTTICDAVSDAQHCACKRFCTDPSFSKPDAKITCAPFDDKTTVQCVCTYGSDFSGVCYEKKGELCSFELGCCAKYFSGK